MIETVTRVTCDHPGCASILSAPSLTSLLHIYQMQNWLSFREKYGDTKDYCSGHRSRYDQIVIDSKLYMTEYQQRILLQIIEENEKEDENG